MPIFDGLCKKCGEFELFLHPTEKFPKRCVRCDAAGFTKVFMKVAPRVQGDIADWSNENGGKGRYCPQAGKKPNDPNAFFTSRTRFEDWGKSKGYTVNRS